MSNDTQCIDLSVLQMQRLDGGNMIMMTLLGKKEYYLWVSVLKDEYPTSNDDLLFTYQFVWGSNLSNRCPCIVKSADILDMLDYGRDILLVISLENVWWRSIFSFVAAWSCKSSLAIFFIVSGVIAACWYPKM